MPREKTMGTAGKTCTFCGRIRPASKLKQDPAYEGNVICRNRGACVMAIRPAFPNALPVPPIIRAARPPRLSRLQSLAAVDAVFRTIEEHTGFRFTAREYAGPPPAPSHAQMRMAAAAAVEAVLSKT
jgi:hypothetical protein